ncbi:MAG TPA: DNA-3-methyladenine glycosylase I [Opitutaceae bacterium]
MKKPALKKALRVDKASAKRSSKKSIARMPKKKATANDTLPESPIKGGLKLDGRPRCHWARNDALMADYHDNEWGKPEHRSRELWEKLILDGFQAGLSWITILRKREAFRRAFRGFDPEAIAKFTAADVAELLQDAGIIRSRAKIEAAVGNAKAYLAMRAAGEDFSAFVWGFVNGEPIRETRRLPKDIPAKTPLSEKVSAELKKRGFKFVGPVIVYAWLQAVGVVDDHLVTCFCHQKR